MNFEELLRGVSCTCGRHHTCDIKHVYVEDGAIAHLGTLVGKRKSILLVADGNTYAAAGRNVEAQLEGKSVKRIVFPGEELLIPDERAIAAVTELTDGAELIVGIGSGVVQDLCKYVSHTEGIPYIIVATAPSMDGYASSGAAMITGGMKVTYSAGVPEAVIADVSVLKDAPMEMIKAGYGDVVGKYSALNDWRLSALVNGEYICEYVYELTHSMLRATVPLAEKLLMRDPCSVKTLTEALIGVGIAMSFAGNSRPASGSEHHLSHFFEITGIVRGEEYLPHGIDVVYSTAVTAAVREKLVSRPFPKKGYKISEGEYVSEMKRVYGEATGEGCIALQKKLGMYEKDRVKTYLEKEEEIKAVLRECPTAEEIKALVSAVKLDMDAFLSFYGKEKIAEAVRYAKDLKDRYTVLWLYYDLYGLEETV